MTKFFVFGFIFAAALALSACGEKENPTWAALRENRQGVQALNAKNPGLAQEHFAQGLSSSPYQSQIHHNLGLTLEEQKKPDDAIKSYQNADQLATTEEGHFAARFNSAILLGAAGKIDEALAAYQKALDIQPSSIEVKTNIELLLKKQDGKGGKNDQDDKNQDQKKKDQKNQDQKDQDKDQQKKDDQGKDKKDEKPSQYDNSPKYKPRPFKGDLSEAEVKKILGEIKQQEQKIRFDYSRKEVKERPRDKDW